jgi:hypothetical protein
MRIRGRVDAAEDVLHGPRHPDLLRAAVLRERRPEPVRRPAEAIAIQINANANPTIATIGRTSSADSSAIQ